MLLPLGPLLGHHASCGELLLGPITTIVISVGRFFVNHDELLPTSFRLLNVVFSQFLEEIHNPGHSLGVRLRTFGGGDDLLTEDTADYTTVRQRTRDRAFRELVLEAYNETCAVCGANRHSPDGTPEVEAAHIYPRSENGRDDVRNGIALCRLHHWAFDTGWVEITTDYEITVLEEPDREEYHEFKQLDGREIQRPNSQIPHPDYVAARQQL